MAEPQVKYTAAEYLALERESEEKHEFLDGQIYAMAGASQRHNLITLNLGAELRAALRGGPCETYTNDMRVKVSKTGLYSYPDVTVVCDKPEFDDEVLDTLLNPLVLIEVLSPSTADYDRGAKFAHYRSLASVQEILHVDQESVHLVHYRRQDDETWLLSETKNLEGSIELPVLGVEIGLARIYERVEFEETPAPAPSEGSLPS